MRPRFYVQEQASFVGFRGCQIAMRSWAVPGISNPGRAGCHALPPHSGADRREMHRMQAGAADFSDLKRTGLENLRNSGHHPA